MKLFEWKMRKNKSQKGPRQCKKNPEKTSEGPQEPTSREELGVGPHEVSEAPVRLAGPEHSHEEQPLQAQHQYNRGIYPSASLLGGGGWNFEDFIEIPEEHIPLVDSSFRFSPTRTENESLQMLATSPELAEHALEILLVNWSPCVDYMQYAMSFLEERTYCSSILKSTSIQPRQPFGKSLFEFVEQNVPKNQRRILAEALLRADLATQPDLAHSGQLLPWAETWRKASQNSDWESARLCLMDFKAEFSAEVRECALKAVAEHLLGRHKAQIEIWQTRRGEQRHTAAYILEKWKYPEEDRNKYLAILNDCRHRNLDLHSSWYMYLLEIIRIHDDYINLTKWRESGSKVLV